MFEAGDGSQKAPAQRVDDFVNGVLSPELNDTSYIPGLISAPLHEILPNFVYKRLRQGLIDIDKKMKGYKTNQANIIGKNIRVVLGWHGQGNFEFTGQIGFAIYRF